MDRARQDRTGQDRLKLCLLHICVGICIIGSSSLVLVFKDQTSSFHGYHRKCACEKKKHGAPSMQHADSLPLSARKGGVICLTVSVFFGFLLLLACNVRPRLCFSLKHSPSSWRKTCLYLLYYLVSGLRRALLAFRGVDTTAWRVCVVAQQRYVLCEVHAIDRNGTLTSKILQMQR